MYFVSWYISFLSEKKKKKKDLFCFVLLLCSSWSWVIIITKVCTVVILDCTLAVIHAPVELCPIKQLNRSEMKKSFPYIITLDNIFLYILPYVVVKPLSMDIRCRLIWIERWSYFVWEFGRSQYCTLISAKELTFSHLLCL